MANQKSGPVVASAGQVTDVHSTQQNPLGARLVTTEGNEFIYLAGAASMAAYDAVSFNATTYTAVRLAPNAVGSVAIAQAAVLAANWGWFQIAGFGSCNSDTVSAAGGLFIDATTGRVDDASVAGDMIYGMVSTGADVSNVCPVQLLYPMVTNTVPA